MARLMRTGADMNNKNIVNLADGSSATDAVTKQQLDAAVRGLSWKQAVRAATTTNGTLATAFANGQTIDGVTLATGDRILLKNQTTGSENGIYVVAASGAPTRALDADSSAEIDSMAVFVESGTVNADRMYVLSTDNPTLGSTSLTYAQLGGSGSVYVAGSGLTESPAGTFNVGAGTGISVNADDVQINTSIVPRKNAQDCVATTNPQNFAHGGTAPDVIAQVVRKSDGVVVDCDVTIGATNISVDWGAAPSAAEYRVVWTY